MKRCCWLIGLVLTVSASLFAGSSLERALKHVPENTGVVVILPSLDGITKGVNAFGKAIDMEEMIKFDIVEAMDFEDEVGEGFKVVDRKGAFLLTVTSDAEEGVGIFEVTDPSVFEKMEGATKDDDGVISVLSPEERYYGVVGNLILVAKEKSLVRSALKSDGKTGEMIRKTAGDLLDKSQALVYVDTLAMKSKLDEGFMMFEQMAPMMAAMMGPQGAAAGASISFMVSELKTAVADSRVWWFAGRIGTDGFAISAASHFRDDSKMAAYLKGVKSGKNDLLAALPDQRSIVTVAYDFLAPADSESFSEKLSRVMIAEMKFEDPSERERVESAVKRSVEAARTVTGMSMTLALTPEKQMVSSGVMFTTDGGLLLKNFEATNEMSQLMGKALGGGAIRWTINTSKETIAGQDAMISSIDLESDDPNVTGMLEMMYGGTRMTSIAAAAKEHVVFAGGPAEASRAQAEKLLKHSGPGFAANSDAKAALASISPKPQGVVLLDFGMAFDWAMGLANAMGGGMIPQVKFDPNVKSMAACGMYLGADSARLEMYVPSQAIKALMDAIKKMEDAGESEGEDSAT